MNKRLMTILCGMIGLAASLCMAQNATLNVQVDKPGIAVSPDLYGIFFEEINRAGEGGIYPELVMNRSLESGTDRETKCWSLVKQTGADGSFARSTDEPLNSANRCNLKLEIKTGPFVGVANSGFDGGMHVKAGESYNLTLFAKSSSGDGNLSVQLQQKDGKSLGEAAIAGVNGQWTKYSATLKPSADAKDARLVIGGSSAGVYFLDVISLMPAKTWKNRPNGLREDLMEMIADMKPAFVRFPGGCYVEGDQIKNAFRWKKTIGPIEERPGHWNLWGYYSSDGLGYHEYLQMCEDLGSKAMYVINCGMAHGGVVPMDQMPEYVQDALDAIEYANGPADSKWGAVRAANGHPAPFNLKYLEIGNENGGPAYSERYALFYDAIKAKYPDIQLIACNWGGKPNSKPVEILDEHYYESPAFFVKQFDRYDRYKRGGEKIYVGEYAVTKGCGRGNLIAAMGEAVYMCGMERNSDVVRLASYAPLLVDPKWSRWNPNAIVFDPSRAYGIPSYYVQAMFAQNRVTTNLPLQIQSRALVDETPTGAIGLGTWGTQAQFKDVKFTAPDGKVLFESNFTADLNGWRSVRGQWAVQEGMLVQSSDARSTRILLDKKQFASGTLSLKARKTGGNEGFCVLFHTRDGMANWINLGGWNNTAHGVETEGPAETQSVPGKIEADRWYDIRVELNGAKIKCFLDDKLILETQHASPHSMFGAAGIDAASNDIVLKVVNMSSSAQKTTLNINGAGQLQGQASGVVLSSASAQDENSFESPTKIVPQKFKIDHVGPIFEYEFPGNSVTILRLPQAR